jgi:SNF2 family DNA or RNA helicase
MDNANLFNIKVHDIPITASKATPPSGINMELKPHQLLLLQRCIDLEANVISFKDYPELREQFLVNENDYMNVHIGVIADKVGAGKSYVILSLIMTDTERIPRNYKIQTFGNNKLVLYLSEKMTSLQNTNVIIIPHNLVNQWKDYIDNFTTGLKYTMIVNSKCMEPFIKSANTIADYRVILVTASMYNHLANLLLVHSMKVRRVFYDEVDSMNIPSAVEMPAQFYWFVTASYGNLLYPRGFRSWDGRLMKYVYHAAGMKSNGFIRKLFFELQDTLKRQFINLLVLKNNDAFVDSCFGMTHPDMRIILSKESNSISVLHGLVERNIMECLNAGDERTAIEMIDWKRKNSEHGIIEIMIQKFSDDIHNLNVQQQAILDMTFPNEQDKIARISKVEDRRKVLEDKMKSIRERISSTQSCSICYDDMVNKSVTDCCNNSFCFKCIHTWINMNSTCPLCKRILLSKDIYVVANVKLNVNLQTEEETSQYYDKIKNLMIILKNGGADAKFLIFSNYDNTFFKMAAELKRLNISFEYLKGNKFQIGKRLKDFREGSMNVLLVNATQYGSGLNIECTTDVVMFHKCDSEVEKQIIGRAQRAGRTSTLRIWYLVHANETRDIIPSNKLTSVMNNITPIIHTV